MKRFKVALLIISVFNIFESCYCARILGISPTPSISHQSVFHPLWRELSLRGHEVLVLTTDPLYDASLTNLTEISLHDESYTTWNSMIQGIFENSDYNLYGEMSIILKAVNEVGKVMLEHPKVQNIIKDETQHFDLVIVEYMYPLMYAFAERFKCPYIAMTTLDPFGSIYRQIGSYSHPVLNPDVSLPCEETLTFENRIRSVVNTLIITYLYESHYGWFQEVIEKNFGKNYPTIEEITQNMSMLFVNSNQIMYRIRSFAPNVIQIGGSGAHLKPLKPLPQKLKTFLDKATQGFVYFSLGSNIKSKDLSKEKLDMITKTFSELPYAVLWKFEEENLKVPPNVMISKWLPQQDVLRHPHIKLFITQGGLQSLEEALHSHVPLIAIPFFGDQKSNAKRIEVKGIGAYLEFNTLQEEIFKKTILEVGESPRYRERAKELSELVLDEPMTGLQRAVWWTEYVIRHKGAKHFKNPAINLPLYQYYLLDVIGFFLFILISPYIVYKLIRLII